MNELYKKIIKQIVSDGKRIRKKSGIIQDIGIKKQYLTEEDIKIERGLERTIKDFDSRQELYAEEEHNNFLDMEDVWVIDPISGTRPFINGLPHYGIVAAHVHNREVQFSVVYDPSMDDLYTAYKNKGAYLNGKKISMKETVSGTPKIIFNLSINWANMESARKIFYELSNFDLYRVPGSFAVNDSLVACGKYDGVVSLNKDSFPCFASSLIIREAGGIFTNIDGDKNINPDDRVFVGGDRNTYQKLKLIVEKMVRQ